MSRNGRKSGQWSLHITHAPSLFLNINKVPYVPWSAAEKSLRWEVADTRTWSSTGFSERSRSCSNSLISFLFLGNYFSIPLENKPYDDLFTFLQLFIYFFLPYQNVFLQSNCDQQLWKLLGTKEHFYMTRVQSPRDFLGIQTWPPFCFVYGRREVMWKRSLR